MSRSLWIFAFVVLGQVAVEASWVDLVFRPMFLKKCQTTPKCRMDCPNGFERNTMGCTICQCAGPKKGRSWLTHKVQTTSGPVVGKITRLPTGKYVDQFLGIRYAKATRFEKPAPPTPWTDVFYATSFGENCPQRQGVNDDGTLYPEIAEECLFINVFVPHRWLKSGERFHVMHWIHGGSYMSYSGDQVGAEVLASEGDVIVVTFNYRLGALGYLATGDSELPGNYGMFDQQAALKWTKDNIEKFGGDPNSVTLFGESAGAFSVSLQVLSPAANDLFHQVIAESGAATALASLQPIEIAQNTARKFANQIGCAMEGLKTCLMDKTYKEIYDAQAKTITLFELSYLTWGPVVDGDFLLDTPDNLLQKGEFIQRNVLQGFNNDEGGLFIMLLPGVENGIPRWMVEFTATVMTFKENQTKENTDSLLFQYTDWTNPDDPISNRRNMMDVISDMIFKAPTIKTVQAYVRKNPYNATYLYQLEHGPDVDWAMGPMPDWLEAYHFADVTYVFGIPLLQPNATDDEVKFSKDIMKFWSNFAKTGNPTPEGSTIKWPKYTLDAQQYLALKPDDFEVKSKVRADYMEFWNTYLPKQDCVVTSCVNQADGTRFPYTGDCTKYYECHGGKAKVKSCFLLYFSVFTYECVFPFLSGCQMESK